MLALDVRLEPLLCAGFRAFVCLLVIAVATGSRTCGQCSFAGSPTGEPLTYSFETLVRSGKLVLSVTLEFRGGPEGSAELILPSNWAEQSHLERQATGIRALSGATVVLDTAIPSVKTLRFQPDQSVKISYELMKDWEGPFVYPKQFRAVLEPTYFEFTTQNALVHPTLKPTDVVSAHFDWQKLPANWTLGTSFGADERCQSFTGLWNQVNNALFAGGDFRVHHVKAANQPLVVAIRGKWDFVDEEAIGQIQKILEAEREFWHDHDFPYYLVTLSPFEVRSGSSDGSSFTNAFWVYLPWEDTFSYEVHYMLAHESFHGWNPYKMGVIKQPEASEKWSTEGFTVYYGDLLLLRSGVLPLPEYVERLNKRTFDYESSPLKNLSNKELVARYEENSVNQLPYVRCPVLALWLDAQIRRQSKNRSSLDAVMLTLAQEGSKNPAVELSSERVLRVAGKHLNRKSRKQLLGLVENGESIPIPDFPNNPCVRLDNENLPLFDLGLDGDVLRSKKVAVNVREDSEAFKAGVRDGQEVLGMSVTWNNVSKPVQLTVRTASGQQRIEYFPKGKTVSVPQYRLNKKLWTSTPERCTFPSN
jgi:predicted metalloprotease with PDZ domain